MRALLPRLRLLTVFVAVAVAVGVAANAAGCSEGGLVKTPGASPSVSQAPSSVGSGASLPVASRVDLPKSDFGETAGPAFAGVDLVSKTYILSHTADPRLSEVRRRTDNKVVLRHRTSAPELVTVFGDIADDILVIVDEDTLTSGSGSKDAAEAFIYNLRTGDKRRLADVAGAPQISSFGRQAMVTDDGRYYYSASVQRPGNSFFNCIAMLNLQTFAASTVDCAGDGANETVAYYVNAGRDGATWLHIEGPQIESCRIGRGIRGGSVVGVGPQDDCATVGTVTLDRWDVWSATATPAGPLSPEIGLYATDGKQTVALGRINGAALTMCGDYAYWRVADRPSKTMQLRRWRPGLSNVESVFTVSAREDEIAAHAIGFGGCSDGIFTIQDMSVDGSVKSSKTRIWAIEPSP